MSVAVLVMLTCLLTKSQFTASVSMMYFAMKLRIARSVCGLKTMALSASSKLRFSKVESTCTWAPFLVRRVSVSRDHRMGCISAMLAPQSTKVSACSRSS